MATAPRNSETHGGDDVGVYASGPWSHLFIGSYEQSNIPIAMAYAAKIGPYVAESDETCSGGVALKLPIVVMGVVILLMRLMF